MDIRIKNVIAAVLEIPINDINEKTTSETVENWDSLKQMLLIIALEEEFEIEYSDEDRIQMLNYTEIYNRTQLIVNN